MTELLQKYPKSGLAKESKIFILKKVGEESPTWILWHTL
jgi:hypothetical protein